MIIVYNSITTILNKIPNISDQCLQFLFSLASKVCDYYNLCQYLHNVISGSDGINNIDGGTRIAVDHPNATCGIFTTFPAAYVSLSTGFFEQVS